MVDAQFLWFINNKKKDDAYRAIKTGLEESII